MPSPTPWTLSGHLPVLTCLYSRLPLPESSHQHLKKHRSLTVLKTHLLGPRPLHSLSVLSALPPPLPTPCLQSASSPPFTHHRVLTKVTADLYVAGFPGLIRSRGPLTLQQSLPSHGISAISLLSPHLLLSSIPPPPLLPFWVIPPCCGKRGVPSIGARARPAQLLHTGNSHLAFLRRWLCG